MHYRQIFVTFAAVAIVFGCVFPVTAQETADICIANEIVARIRAAGPYDSVKDRATAIDKAIVSVLSNHDTNNPDVSLKQQDDVWTVFCWDVPVIGVYPAEAEANNLTEKQLGQIWTNKIREQLPKATPVSKMEDPFGAATRGEGTSSEAAATPPTSDRPETVIAQAEETETDKPEPAAEADIPDSAALILIIDALRVGRGLNEDQWIDQREQIARNLLNNLRRFIASRPADTSLPVVAGGTTTRIEPSAATAPMTGTETVSAPEAPPAETEEPAVEETVTPPPAETTEVPAEETEEKPDAAAGEPKAEEGQYPDDPAYAKVPQKKRIGRKFEAARDPFYELQDTNPQQAEEIDTLLAKARDAFTKKQFDTCEQYVDRALRALGIDPASIE